jgi:hypothetical protein
MIPVKSTVIKAAEHLPAMSSLKIEFHSGKKYLYHPVSKKEYDGFMNAESKGNYFNEHFRGRGKTVFN